VKSYQIVNNSTSAEAREK